MYCAIKNGIRTMLIEAGASGSFWVEWLYGVCIECNCKSRPGCNKTPEKQLTGRKTGLEHLQGFCSKVWARGPDKTREALDGKARSGALLQCLFYGKCRIML